MRFVVVFWASQFHVIVQHYTLLHSKGFYQQIWGAVTVLKFLQTLALDFPYICLQFFPGNFSLQEEKFLQTNVSKILKSCNALKFFH